MTPLDRLRLGVAMVHGFPGARLTLRTRQGETIDVGTHPTATIDPCAMRRVVLACACPGQPDYAERVDELVVGGTLHREPGGICSASVDGRSHRVFPTLLSVERLAGMLDEADALPALEGVPSDVIHAVVKPDRGLGVSVLVVSSSDPVYEDRLDELTIELAAECLVEELLSAVTDGRRDPRRTPNSRGGA